MADSKKLNNIKYNMHYTYYHKNMSNRKINVDYTKNIFI